MAVYADYEFYTTQYLGTAIAETAYDALALQAQAGSRADGITSERVGSHSVTYAAPTSHQREITLAAGRWLANTGLLYRGFADGEYSGTL